MTVKTQTSASISSHKNAEANPYSLASPILNKLNDDHKIENSADSKLKVEHP